jgi:hypothetical protein
MPGTAIDPRRLFLVAAGGITLWLLLLFLWHFTFGHGRTVEHVLFLDQDFAALLVGVAGLILLSLFLKGTDWRVPEPRARIVVPLILLCALWSWAGHYLVFGDYVLSRDEESVLFASGYMRDGLLARPIPPEWMDYRRAIMPEFFSPFGAATSWGSAYLPVNAALRTVFGLLGDPNLSGPVLLIIGLAALWRVALRLFLGRPDTVWVALLMALGSAQISVTAMTPYAMTGHFALDILWLALVLRGGTIGHGAAALAALVAGGLHQWHFPPLFIVPFILWMLVQRRWGVALFHAIVLVAIVGLWAKAWPAFLIAHLGAAADVRPSAGVGDKMGSLLRRFSNKWEPLFDIARFLAWNNLLLVPLAALGAARARWRTILRGGAGSIVLPLTLCCLIAFGVALHQGYGWGFRYAHGFLPAFCLLAGYGWIALDARSLRPALLGTALSVGLVLFLAVRAHGYVAPYAASDRLIHRTDADVVLVDSRGGVFATDLVRTDHGVPGRPVVMSLAMLTPAKLDALCARYDVALFDWRAFRALGVRPARWQNGWPALLRAHLDRIDCGRVIIP